jgi:hypothetical protein
VSDFLPRGNYFHVVFTLPERLNGLFPAFKDEMQNILFKSAWETIERFASNPAYPGAQTGINVETKTIAGKRKCIFAALNFSDVSVSIFKTKDSAESGILVFLLRQTVLS